jgi:hypothetical protein
MRFKKFANNATMELKNANPNGENFATSNLNYAIFFF